jgi:hypothetical protein
MIFIEAGWDYNLNATSEDVGELVHTNVLHNYIDKDD